jgi:hypothetical protein
MKMGIRSIRIALILASFYICTCGGLDDPQIESLMPKSGKAGEIVDIVGERFLTRVGTVAFGGKTARIYFWSDQRVRVRVPHGLSGETLVVLKSRTGRPSNAFDFYIEGS